MKWICISVFMILISCTNAKDKKVTVTSDRLPVEKSDPADTTDTSALNMIKKDYEILHSKLTAKTLDSVSFTYNCDANGRSGTVTYFSEKNTLKIIKHAYGEYSHTESTERFYLKNNTPFFIFKQDTYWTFDGGSPDKPETKDDITEQRFYLQNNTIIACLEKKYTLKSSAKNKVDPNTVSNKKANCSDDIINTYKLLLKNKNIKNETTCLQ